LSFNGGSLHLLLCIGLKLAGRLSLLPHALDSGHHIALLGKKPIAQGCGPLQILVQHL